MSIKGEFQELFVGKKESNIFSSWGNKTKIVYDDLDRIDYCYSSKGEGGYLDFVKPLGHPVRFRFNKKVNEKIEQTIKLIQENNDDLELVEHKVSDMRFYQRTWFIVLMMFCLTPLGLFLMWYHKKYSKCVMVMLTIFMVSLWGSGVYIEYQAYTTALNEIHKALDPVYVNYGDLTSNTSETLLPESSAEAKTYPYSTVFDSGTYKVGDDIPAGEYVVFSKDSESSYFQLSKDSSGNLDSIVANAIFSYNTIVTVESGQYFTLSSSYAVPIPEVETLDTTQNGMFKIGTHLEAGEYMIQANSSEYGYVEVASDSKHLVSSSIMTNNFFENFTYVTVEDGQYLTLSNCYINTDN